MNTKSIETVIYACYLLQDDCNIRERKGVNIYMPEKCKATEETWGPMTTAIQNEWYNSKRIYAVAKRKPGKIQVCWYLNLASAIPQQPSNQLS